MSASMSAIFRYSSSPVVLMASQQAPRYNFNGYGQAIEAYRQGLVRNGMRCINLMPYDERGGLSSFGIKNNDQQPDIDLEVRNPLVRKNRGDDKPYLHAKSFYDEMGPVIMVSRSDNGTRYPEVLASDAYGSTSGTSAREDSAYNVYGDFHSNPISEGFVDYNLALAELARHLRESEPGTPMVFHANDHGTALAASLIAMKGLMPVVYDMHNPLYESTMRGEDAKKLGINPGFFGRRNIINLNMLAANLADMVMTVSPNFAMELANGDNPMFTQMESHRDFTGLLSQRLQDRTFLGVLNALPDRLISRQTPVQYDNASDTLRILWANRPVAEKAFRQFLEAIMTLSQDTEVRKSPRKLAVTVLSGNGNEACFHSGQLLSDLRNQGAIKFSYSPYTEEAMLKALEDTTPTVGVMTSLVEPCGLYAAFLQAQGVPALLARTGGLVDITGDSYAVPVNRDDVTKEGIAAAIKKLLGQEDLNTSLSGMADRAFDRARMLFAPYRVGKDLVTRIYAPLLNEGK